MAGENPLELDPETMRQLGYRAVDLVVERIAGLRDSPAWRGATRAEMERRLAAPPSTAGSDPEGALDRLVADVLPFGSSVDHPRFFAFIPGCPTWPGILGDFLAAGANVFQGTWAASAGATELELVVLDWFKGWLGYPPEAEGILVSGGSHANLTALACARHARLRSRPEEAVVYASTQVHSSIPRALRVLGLGPDQERLLEPDEQFRLSPALLEAAIRDDTAMGRRPLAVVANAGATSTGAVDPLPELAAVCREHGLWLHVDAAYGGFAVLSERGRRALAGIEQADSITLDPHKWLFQPYGVGCVLVRDGALLEQAFAVAADYLQDVAVAGSEVNLSERGVELTRRARVLKIWLSLETFGVDAFSAAIDRALDLAVAAEETITSVPELELLSPATLGVVCFRRKVPDGGEKEYTRANAHLVSALRESGLGLVSSTRIRGVYALRLCILNHRTRAEDVEDVLRFLAETPIPG